MYRHAADRLMWKLAGAVFPAIFAPDRYRMPSWKPAGNSVMGDPVLGCFRGEKQIGYIRYHECRSMISIENLVMDPHAFKRSELKPAFTDCLREIGKIMQATGADRLEFPYVVSKSFARRLDRLGAMVTRQSQASSHAIWTREAIEATVARLDGGSLIFLGPRANSVQSLRP